MIQAGYMGSHKGKKKILLELKISIPEFSLSLKKSDTEKGINNSKNFRLIE
jgi:hypothetical protein